MPTLPSAGSSEEEQISEEDAAVLRYVGFDTRRLRDEARAKQASKTSGGRTAATTAPSPGPSAAAADRQRKQVLALLLVVAFGAALYLGPCAGEETSEDGFRVIDE